VKDGTEKWPPIVVQLLEEPLLEHFVFAIDVVWPDETMTSCGMGGNCR